MLNGGSSGKGTRMPNGGTSGRENHVFNGRTSNSEPSRQTKTDGKMRDSDQRPSLAKQPENENVGETPVSEISMQPHRLTFGAGVAGTVQV